MVEQTEELFWKYAFCKKCKKKANYCDCDIGEPIMMLAQFEECIKELMANGDKKE